MPLHAWAADPQFDRLLHESRLNEEPAKIVTADLEQDGHADLILLSVQTDQLSIFMGNGDGTFEAVHHHVQCARSC